MNHELIVLGCGEGGKATISKAASMVFNKEYSSAIERYKWRDVLRSNALSTMKALLQYGLTNGLSITDEETMERVNRIVQMERVNLVLEMQNVFTEATAKDLVELWKCESVKELLAKQSGVHNSVTDVSEYYFANLERIVQSDYVPSRKDILLARRKTTGLSNSRLNIDGLTIKLQSCGGQRNERRIWQTIIDNIDVSRANYALMFVVSLAEFNMVCREDNVTNRLIESIEQWKRMCTNRKLRQIPFVLLFNKVDLFRDKVMSKQSEIAKSMQQFFPEYKGDITVSDIFNFITAKFLKVSEEAKKSVHLALVVGTKKKNVEDVFRNIPYVFAQNRKASAIAASGCHKFTELWSAVNKSQNKDFLETLIKSYVNSRHKSTEAPSFPLLTGSGGMLSFPFQPTTKPTDTRIEVQPERRRVPASLSTFTADLVQSLPPIQLQPCSSVPDKLPITPSTSTLDSELKAPDMGDLFADIVTAKPSKPLPKLKISQTLALSSFANINNSSNSSIPSKDLTENNNMYSDVVFRFDEEMLFCHSSVLMMRCNELYKRIAAGALPSTTIIMDPLAELVKFIDIEGSPQLASEPSAKKCKPVPILVINGKDLNISYQAMHRVLSYMYTGTLEDVSPKAYSEIIQFAKEYRFSSIKDALYNIHSDSETMAKLRESLINDYFSWFATRNMSGMSWLQSHKLTDIIRNQKKLQPRVATSDSSAEDISRDDKPILLREDSDIVTLIVEKQQIYVHQFMLPLIMPNYTANMSAVTTLALPGVRFEPCLRLLSYLYGDSKALEDLAEFPLNVLLGVMSLAREWKITVIETRCQIELQDRVTVANAVNILDAVLNLPNSALLTSPQLRNPSSLDAIVFRQSQNRLLNRRSRRVSNDTSSSMTVRLVASLITPNVRIKHRPVSPKFVSVLPKRVQPAMSKNYQSSRGTDTNICLEPDAASSTRVLNSVARITDLPDDVCHYIFTFFVSGEDDLWVLRNTCSKFSALVLDTTNHYGASFYERFPSYQYIKTICCSVIIDNFEEIRMSDSWAALSHRSTKNYILRCVESKQQQQQQQQQSDSDDLDLRDNQQPNDIFSLFYTDIERHMARYFTHIKC